jgi:glycosyltransferase involved in cell wall biosynthesis
MTGRPLRILQVNTFDSVGGAGKVARDLFQAYRARGYDSWLAVGQKLGTDPNVLLIPNHQATGAHARLRDTLSAFQMRHQRLRPPPWLSALARLVLKPGRALERFCGVEDFRFPGTRRLLNLTHQRPDIVHCHNLHGGYFDLRALSWLSRELPVVLTLHDAWLLSGHCAHSLDCERWRTGCGRCPDLTLDPSIRRDATAYNWRRKQKIFDNSRLYLATPCHWLMHKVEQSMLAPAVMEARVIPNGVDLAVFHPAQQGDARSSLGIPPETRVVLFTAYALRQNIWKDYRTVQDAVALTAGRIDGHDVLFLALGQGGPADRVGSAVVRFVPYETDPKIVARYYQAADVYVHAARADTFPTAILEALACGTPVVATAVGGIPEQVEDGATGFLVPAADASALAERLTQLLSDHDLRGRMAVRAAEVVGRQFDLVSQADAYLDWYRDLLHRESGERVVRGS